MEKFFLNIQKELFSHNLENCNASEIDQVFFNIIHNAVPASENNSVIKMHSTDHHQTFIYFYFSKTLREECYVVTL